MLQYKMLPCACCLQMDNSLLFAQIRRLRTQPSSITRHRTLPETPKNTNRQTTANAENLTATSQKSSIVLDRKVSINRKHHYEILAQKPEERTGSKLLKLAVLGAPNAGKSVLTNSLVGAAVSGVSQKVHTTRELTTGVLIDSDTQVIIYDTPGAVSSHKAKQHKLDRSLLVDPENSLTRADIIAVMTDVGDMRRTRLDPEILHLLYRYRPMPSILVMNKVDLVKKKYELLPLTNRLTKGFVGGRSIAKKLPKLTHGETDEEMAERLVNQYKTIQSKQNVPRNVHDHGVTLAAEEEESEVKNPALRRILGKPMHEVMVSELRKVFRDEYGWPYFEAVFMVSALHGEGMQELKDYLFKRARAGKWQFHSKVLTSRDPVRLTEELIRSEMLDELPKRIPYELKFKLMIWEISDNDILTIRYDVICDHERLIKRIVGKDGVTINRIAQVVSQKLRNLFQKDVYLKLGVQATKKWKPLNYYEKFKRKNVIKDTETEVGF